MTDAANAIAMQLRWDRLLSVVEEQATTLIRTGFSTSTREAGDVSAGVFDRQGRMLANAVTGTPGHVNAMARAVKHFLRVFPVAQMAPGDVFLTNDPWLGTGHLHDFTFVTPTFRDGRVVALFASTSHVVDVGGRGLGAEARQVYEEGLQVPIMHFARAGAVDETLLALVRANVREPVQVLGDLYSLAACNDTGCRRLQALMDDTGMADLEALSEHIIARSRAAALDRIAQVPAGRHSAQMRVDGFETPIDLCATLTTTPDGLHLDYAGTSALSRYGINVPLAYTEAYSAFGLKTILMPEVPNNEGSLSVVTVTAPEHSILNPQRPAPVALRHVIGQMLPDVVFGCLEGALGSGRVPAEGSSSLWTLQVSGGPGRAEGDQSRIARARSFTVVSFHSGGTGARPGKDGLSATAFPSGVRNVPVEVNEAVSPIIFWRKEYRTDSGGAGEFRGGLGQVMEIASLDPAPFSISAMYDRVIFPPRGREGGGPGACGRLTLSDGTALRGKGEQTVPEGRRLVIEMAGGAGLGDPLRRDPEAVARDVAAGLVSAAAALRDHRVALTAGGAVDRDETQRLRAAAEPDHSGGAR